MQVDFHPDATIIGSTTIASLSFQFLMSNADQDIGTVGRPTIRDLSLVEHGVAARPRLRRRNVFRLVTFTRFNNVVSWSRRGRLIWEATFFSAGTISCFATFSRFDHERRRQNLQLDAAIE